MEAIFKLLRLRRPAWLTDSVYYSNIGVTLNAGRVCYSITILPFHWKWGRCEGDRRGIAPGFWIGPILLMVQKVERWPSP
jgi:hypothetical protein